MAELRTVQNFSDKSNPTVTYSNPAGNNISELGIAIYNSTGTQSYVPYKYDVSKTGTSYTFDLTEEERNNLRRASADSKSIPIRFYLRTVAEDGAVYLSYRDATFTVVDALPVVTASVQDANPDTVALTDDAQTLIKYHSEAYVSMEAVGQKYASIDESLYIIRNGNNNAYAKYCSFVNVESNEFLCQAEDSRGNVGSTKVIAPMVDYIKLTCNIESNRPDAVGNMTVACYGNYFNGSFGAVDNSLTVQYRYAETGGTYSEWVDMNVTVGETSYYASATFVIEGFVQSQSYSFETRAIDALETISSAESAVKSTPIFHWGEEDFQFEVPVTVNGDQKITGDLWLKGSGNYGNKIRFGDGDYCYIAEETDDALTIKGTTLNLKGNSIKVNDVSLPLLQQGTWTPTLYSSAISSYTTRYGWYNRVGSTVTVGFFIKATCYSGYHGTPIEISGLPIVPSYASAGGGMCSGAYVSGGYDFQCFVAETDATITTRAQSCNNTSATNLSTSASGCNYRYGGGEITLSGTITYYGYYAN